MMFGTRDQFLYYECSGCGCLQISEVPENIDKYYPPYYYSFNSRIPRLQRKKTGITSFLRNFFTKKKEKKLRLQASMYLEPANAKPNHKVLDIGCGRGELICRLFNMGYENVEGTDKYLPEAISYDFGVKVRKKDLTQIESNSYDIVMMHHVLEHMFEPEQEIKECYRILKSKSFLIIRIPIKNFAWHKYGENWVQLDAPRHFFIHTIKSMELLAKKTRFEMHSKEFDSVDFQFIGSELYKRDIPLHGKQTGKPVAFRERFDKQQRKFFKKEAKSLNEQGLGDQAIFYLYKH
jgi:2-polyprenyl-3-methyl-5-hydroxy-6-metoxy-1,4-benzoquinol methylase